ncbi:MAG: ATP-binding cassette domain-containing protein [Pseudomonadota bacterium]|nr:ATP-binding cassette domain-containing protein [Pseudomonadota bacterium]
MAPPLLSLRNVSLSFSQTPLLTKVDLSIFTKDRICLVGRNGAGKSCLLKVIAGLIEIDNGERFIQPGTKISYLTQEPSFFGYKTVKDFIYEDTKNHDLGNQYKSKIFMDALEISENLNLSTLSGGEARRIALARVLSTEPDILLLDEPTNHLDIKTIEWLEEELKNHLGAVVIISHDRKFLNNLTHKTFWLDRCNVKYLKHGFEQFETWADEILLKEEVESKKLKKLIAKEEMWSRQGISARRKRNQGRLRKLIELRANHYGKILSPEKAKISLTSGEISGKLVVDIDKATKCFGKKIIFKDFSTRILRGDKIGIIGPNGAGKTTLAKVLMGKTSIDGGKIKLGTNLTPVFLKQDRSQLDPEINISDFLCSQGGEQVFVDGISRHVISYLKDFSFTPNQAKSPIKSLSGGEKNRLLLAKILATPSNLMVLDEPTNDLDLETLEILQEVLSDYNGTLVLVSHDRDFIDRIVTSTIVLEGDGSAEEFPGVYSDYMMQKRKKIKVNNTSKKAKKKKSNTLKVKRTKLSYKDEKNLKELPLKIENIDKKIFKLTKKMEATKDYADNQYELKELANSASELINKKKELEETWLSLELEKEKNSKL